MSVGMIRFDETARQALAFAHEEAASLGHSKIGPGHILLGILRVDSKAGDLLQEQGADLEKTRQIVTIQTSDSEKARNRSGKIDLAEATQRILERAVSLTRQKPASAISSEHILLALIELNDNRTINLITELGLDRNKLKEQVQQALAVSPESFGLEELLDALEICRRLIKNSDSIFLKRINRIEAILHDYFRQ